MSNPLKSMIPQAPIAPAGGNPIFAQIQQFAGLIGNRNPQQMAMNLARQRGVSDDQMHQLMDQAQQIAQQMGLR